MVKVALFVRLEAKPGQEKAVEQFLLGGLPLVQDEPATTAWFGLRLGPTTFGIFDAFPNDAGRQAHLSGRVAAALMAKAPELFAKPPSIEKILSVETADVRLRSISVFQAHCVGGSLRAN